MNAPDFAKGEKITEPGIYSGIPIDRYHSDLCDGPSISSSGLRTIFLQSAAHYFDRSIYNPDRDTETNDEPRHFILGRAAHHLLLGQRGFAQEFVLRPSIIGGAAWQGNRTVCREWVAAQAKVGKTIVTPDELSGIKRMAKMLDEHPLVHAGILRGKVEQSILWRDEATGIWLKARPDAMPNDSDDFADLKTTTSIAHDDLSRAIGAFGYHMQGALIGWGARAVTGRPMASFNLIFQESKRPHCVAVRRLQDRDLEAGEEECKIALRIFARGIATGEWLGPDGTQYDSKWIGRRQWDEESATVRLNALRMEINSWTKKTEKPVGLA